MTTETPETDTPDDVSQADVGNADTIDATDAERPDVTEARKYRKRAQDAEAERDNLRARVDNLQRAELARIVASLDTPLHEKVNLTEVFPELDALRTDDGDLDTDAISAAVEQLQTERPYLFEVKPTANLARFQGNHEQIPTGTTWADALAP